MQIDKEVLARNIENGLILLNKTMTNYKDEPEAIVARKLVPLIMTSDLTKQGDNE